MAKSKVVSGQMDMADLMLEMSDAETFILIAVNGDDVSVFSTLDSAADTASYLQAAGKAVSE